jgi:flagellar biosynthesis chaperone FliJ
MKRYHFALETVLRVRRAQEEAAVFALAHANQQLRLAQAAHRTAQLRCEELVLDQNQQDRESFRRERDVTERRAAAVLLARAVVDAANEEAEARYADWAAAARLVAAVERLDERRRQEWRVEEQRAEMAAIDESAIVGWLSEAATTPTPDSEVGVPA